MPPLPLWMRGASSLPRAGDSQGKGCSPSPQAALQQDAATRREEMDGSCLGAQGRLQSTHWPCSGKADSKGIQGKS